MSQSPDKRFTIGSPNAELHFCGVLGVLPLATGCALAVVTQVRYMCALSSAHSPGPCCVEWVVLAILSASLAGDEPRLLPPSQATLAATVEKHRILRVTETRVFALPGHDPIKSAFVAAMRADRIMR